MVFPEQLRWFRAEVYQRRITTPAVFGVGVEEHPRSRHDRPHSLTIAFRTPTNRGRRIEIFTEKLAGLDVEDGRCFAGQDDECGTAPELNGHRCGPEASLVEVHGIRSPDFLAVGRIESKYRTAGR